MVLTEEIAENYSYFFEVLLNRYMEIEDSFGLKSSFLSLFRKTHYQDRVNKFDDLRKSAIELRDSLPLLYPEVGDNTVHRLVQKMKECYELFIEMTATQSRLNADLHKMSMGRRFFRDGHGTERKLIVECRYELQLELLSVAEIFEAAVGELEPEGNEAKTV